MGRNKTVGRHKSAATTNASSEEDTLRGAELDAALGTQTEESLDSGQKFVNCRCVNLCIVQPQVNGTAELRRKS